MEQSIGTAHGRPSLTVDKVPSHWLSSSSFRHGAVGDAAFGVTVEAVHDRIRPSEWMPRQIQIRESDAVQYGAGMARTARPVTIRLDLDGASRCNATERLTAALLAQLVRGTLTDGDALPSTRALAAETGLSRTTVVQAYDELVAAGFLEARQGSGTSVVRGAVAAVRAGAGHRVGTAPPADPPPTKWRHGADATYDLRPGQPDTSLISGPDWRRAWRVAAHSPIPATTPWLSGHRELQGALCHHLRRHRGVRANPDDIVIVPGASAAFRAIAAVTADAMTATLVEDPGYRRAVESLRPVSKRLGPVAVDDDGLDPSRLPHRPCLVYVTPAHQYPLGFRLSVERRAALVEWAARTGSLIVEDDYDGEYRYGVPPLPALQSLDQGAATVAYVGTASKILSPSLQVAWLVAPARLRDAIATHVERERVTIPTIVGRALAELISTGALSRHIARTARTYAARRTALLTALRRELPGATITGIEAGLHLCLRLPDTVDDQAVAGDLRARGLLCETLSRHCLGAAQQGLVCGYARLPETRAAGAASLIAAVVNSATAITAAAVPTMPAAPPA